MTEDEFLGILDELRELLAKGETAEAMNCIEAVCEELEEEIEAEEAAEEEEDDDEDDGGADVEEQVGEESQPWPR